MNSSEKPKLHELVDIYQQNKVKISMLNEMKGYKARTMQQMSIEDKNRFIREYGEELFTYYLVHDDEEIVETMPFLHLYQSNEELLKWLIYNGSGYFAHTRLESLNQELERLILLFNNYYTAAANNEKE